MLCFLIWKMFRLAALMASIRRPQKTYCERTAASATSPAFSSKAQPNVAQNHCFSFFLAFLTLFWCEALFCLVLALVMNKFKKSPVFFSASPLLLHSTQSNELAAFFESVFLVALPMTHNMESLIKIRGN